MGKPMFRDCRPSWVRPKMYLLLALSTVVCLFLPIVNSGEAHAATDSTTATYYRSLTIFTTVRTHNIGSFSWENQGGANSLE